MMIPVSRYCVALLFAISAACGSRQGVMTTTPAAVSTTVAPSERRAAEPAGFWSDTIRPFDKLSRGWNRIPGRFGTGCAHDSAYAFKVRPGLPDKVLIYLNGSGACWRAQECDPKGKPTYTMTAEAESDVSARIGMFDYTNEKNPVRDYTMIFVPYCTGDMLLGTREADYEAKGGGTFSVRHGGAANLEAVLDWVYVNLKAPRTVFVAGTDAGAVASPVVAEKVARHYPRARVVQLGEAAGALRSPQAPALFSAWGASEYLAKDPGFRDLDSADFGFERLYIASGRAASRVKFAQYNSADDAAQVAFLGLLGVKATAIPRLLALNLEQIRDAMPSFRSYTAPGRGHGILRTNAMYTTKVEGVAFIDWLSALVDGNAVSDVVATPTPPPVKK